MGLRSEAHQLSSLPEVVRTNDLKIHPHQTIASITTDEEHKCKLK